jgi:hypothetical protein
MVLGCSLLPFCVLNPPLQLPLLLQVPGQCHSQVFGGRSSFMLLLLLHCVSGRYQGSWKAGQRHGQGLMVFSDSLLFRGLWEEDAWLQSAGLLLTFCKPAAATATTASGIRAVRQAGQRHGQICLVTTHLFCCCCKLFHRY